MNLAWVEKCLAELASGTMRFGDCTHCGQLMPADINAGPEGFFASCMLCGRDQGHGYRLGGDISMANAIEYEWLKDPEHQIDWLFSWLTAKGAAVEAAHMVLLDEAVDLAREQEEISVFQVRLAALQHTVTS